MIARDTFEVRMSNQKLKLIIFYALIAVCANSGFVMKENKPIFFTCVFLVVFLLLAVISLKREKPSSKDESSN